MTSRTALALVPASPPPVTHALPIDAGEVAWLNFYRASELEGGLALARVARHVRDGDLVLRLLRHAAEEIEHARLWAETLLALGAPLAPCPRTYQSGYTERLGPPRSVAEVLALTQVFERRVYRHFTRHLRRPAVHPLVRATLERMLEEERDHLGWVHDWLSHRRDVAAIAALLARFRAADERVYQQFLVLYDWRDVP